MRHPVPWNRLRAGLGKTRAVCWVSPFNVQLTAFSHASSPPTPPHPTAPAAVQSSSQVNTNPVIAAVPLMVLTLITLFVGSYTWSQRSM